MKLYKIRGTSEWVPWDVLYNERGYNSVPCLDMTFKSISPWGTSAGAGYKTNGAGVVTYFVIGKTGWYLAYSLPEALGMYPDEATPIQMIKDGVVSDAVWMEFFGSKWYLIQAEIANERYWIHELALPEYGWEIYEGKDYEFILVDGTTGRIIHGVEQLNEMVFAPTGYFTIEDTGDIVFVEQSPYPIVSRFHVDFDTVQTLADGAHIDTILPYYTSKLYIAGIVNRISETIVDFGLTVSNEGGYVRVTNNTGSSVTLTRLAIQSMDATGAEVVEVVDGQDNHAYAFKWDDGGTPYWWISYSGERHWTDTLGNWSEVPSVVLPEVVLLGNAEYDYWLYVGATTANITLSSGNNCPLYSDRGSSSYGWTTYPKAVISCQKYEYSEYWNVAKGRTGLSLVMSTLSGVQWPGCQNDLNESITFIRLKAAYCKNDSATVITVYNSSNVAYNAFKFTASGTDYYYVLDGTQTDWTDDLSSIGYHLPAQYIEVMLNLSRSMGTVTFSANDYWASYAQLTVTVNALNDFGVPLRELNGAKFISATALSDFSFEPVGLYATNGTDVHADMSNFYCAAGGNNPDSDYGNNVNIFSINAYSTPVFTWKCRITKNL